MFKTTVIFLLSAGVTSISGTPPQAVQKAFEQKFFPATNIRWGKESASEWEAEFKINETNCSANFLLDGTWLETETEIPISQLPAEVVTSIRDKYPAWEITGGDKIESVKNGIYYEADLKSGMHKKEVTLMEDGTFTRQTVFPGK